MHWGGVVFCGISITLFHISHVYGSIGKWNSKPSVNTFAPSNVPFPNEGNPGQFASWTPNFPPQGDPTGGGCQQQANTQFGYNDGSNFIPINEGFQNYENNYVPPSIPPLSPPPTLDAPEPPFDLPPPKKMDYEYSQTKKEPEESKPQLAKILTSSPPLPSYGGLTFVYSMSAVAIILALISDLDWMVSAVVGFAPVIVLICSHFAFLPIALAFGLEELGQLLINLGYVIAIWTHLLARAWVGILILFKVWFLIRR